MRKIPLVLLIVVLSYVGLGVIIVADQRNASPYSIPIAKSIFGDRIIAALAKRVAAQYSPYRENRSRKKAAFTKRLNGVG